MGVVVGLILARALNRRIWPDISLDAESKSPDG